MKLINRCRSLHGLPSMGRITVLLKRPTQSPLWKSLQCNLGFAIVKMMHYNRFVKEFPLKKVCTIIAQGAHDIDKHF